MPAIVATTKRWTSAEAHAPMILRAAVDTVSTMSDCPSGGIGLDTSIATSTPSSTSDRSCPSSRSIPCDREISTTSIPRAFSLETTRDPAVPVAPITAIVSPLPRLSSVARLALPTKLTFKRLSGPFERARGGNDSGEPAQRTGGSTHGGPEERTAGSGRGRRRRCQRKDQRGRRGRYRSQRPEERGRGAARQGRRAA